MRNPCTSENLPVGLCDAVLIADHQRRQDRAKSRLVRQRRTKMVAQPGTPCVVRIANGIGACMDGVASTMGTAWRTCPVAPTRPPVASMHSQTRADWPVRAAGAAARSVGSAVPAAALRAARASSGANAPASAPVPRRPVPPYLPPYLTPYVPSYPPLYLIDCPPRRHEKKSCAILGHIRQSATTPSTEISRSASAAWSQPPSRASAHHAPHPNPATIAMTTTAARISHGVNAGPHSPRGPTLRQHAAHHTPTPPTALAHDHHAGNAACCWSSQQQATKASSTARIAPPGTQLRWCICTAKEWGQTCPTDTLVWQMVKSATEVLCRRSARGHDVGKRRQPWQRGHRIAPHDVGQRTLGQAAQLAQHARHARHLARRVAGLVLLAELVVG